MKHSFDTRYELLLDLINLLYEAKEPNEIARELFSRLRLLMSFRSAIFLPVSRHTFEMQSGYCQDCAEEDMDLYLRRYAALDPLVFKASYPSLLNDAIRLSDAAPPAYLARSEFGLFLRRVPFHHSLGVLCGWGEQPVAAIRLYRSSQDHDFSTAEIDLVNRLASHVAHAMYLLETTKKHRSPHETGLSVFAPDLGVFAPDQRLIFRNEAARGVLEGSSPTAILAIAREGAMWQKNGSEIYRTGIVPFRPASLLRWLERGNDRALNLKPTSAAESPNISIRSITIVVTEPFRRRHAIAKRLAWCNLSPREIEVSLGLMRGLSNSEIAQQLFINEKTVKDHLQRIYAKTNVKSRTKLISKVLGLDAELSYNSESECKQAI